MHGRGAQAKTVEITGWSKATMRQLYNYNQYYSRSFLEAAAKALPCEIYELLMPPARAMSIRGLRANTAEIVESDPPKASIGKGKVQKDA